MGADALFITQEDYGHSAPYKVMMQELGYTEEQVAAKVMRWVEGQ